MWNISKTVNRRPTPTKNLGTWGPIVSIGKVLLIPDSFSMVSGHSVQFEKFPILHFFFKTPLISQFSSNSCKLYTVYHNHTGCHFAGDRPKIAKIMAF